MTERRMAKKTYREPVTHEFPAVFDRESRVLLLGSIPSPKSREVGFYYGHPQNRFWKVLAAVLGEDVPATIPQKKAMLKKHHVALWDVLESCTIVGASDTSIEDAVPNRIGDLVKKSKVCRIFCTGDGPQALPEILRRGSRDGCREAPVHVARELCRLDGKARGSVQGDSGVVFIYLRI